jgi:hypothetical protein
MQNIEIEKSSNQDAALFTLHREDGTWYAVYDNDIRDDREAQTFRRGMIHGLHAKDYKNRGGRLPE